MAKDVDSLRKSRIRRREIIAKYGDVPSSVWDMTYTKTNIVEYGKTQDAHATEIHKKMDYDKSLYKLVSMSSKGVRSGALSVFPPFLVNKVVNFYSEKGDTVIDPFAGHNSRMQMTYQLHRNYIGYDISEEFMKFNREVAKKISKQVGFIKNDCKITLHEQSSEKLVEKSNSVDLCFTSPPYYNTEYYGDEPEQLGKSDTYEDFMDRMVVIIKECRRVLRDDKFCVFNVNDFRANKRFYPFHADTMFAFQKAGLKLWDVIVVRWANAIGACFATQVEDRKVCAKMHEYLIVGKKVRDD